MMKKKRLITFTSELLPISSLLITLVGAVYFYGIFPETIPIQWNTAGDVNKLGSKTFGTFFLPLLTLAIYVLLVLLPKIDPKRENYQHFKQAYHRIKNSIVISLTIIYFIAGLAALGEIKNPGSWIISLVGILFIVLGIQLKHLKPNWFMGIRTPWTLADEKVWAKTHILGTKLFTIAGIIITLAPLILHNYEIGLIVFLTIITTLVIIPVVYSYKISKS